MLFTVIGYNEEREGRKVVICYGYLPTFPTRELLSRSVHSENTHNHRVLAFATYEKKQTACELQTLSLFKCAEVAIYF